MEKAHSNINWKNYEDRTTPVNAQNLNKMDVSIDLIDDRVIELDIEKLDKSDAQSLVKKIKLVKETGVFEITYFDDSMEIFDTALEKIAVNFGYDSEAQQLIITLDDGEVKHVDLSAFVTQYEFVSSDTISFFSQLDGKISAIVKNGSITEDKLQPNYLADIKLESEKARLSASEAEQYKNEAKQYANEQKAFGNIVVEMQRANDAGELVLIKETISAKKGSDTFILREGENVTLQTSNPYTGEKLEDGVIVISARNDITGIKGDTEMVYRTGNVNLTPANIGALPVNGTAENAKALGGIPIQGSSMPYSWGVVPYIRKSGLIEVGKYIDFHAAEDGTTDYDVRITADTEGLTVSGLLRGTFVGSLDGTAKKADSVSLTSGTTDTYRNVWFSNSDDASKAVYNANFRYNPYNGILNVPKISITTTGGNWLSGKTEAAINVSNKATNGGYYPVLRISTINGHVWSLGAINDKVGFYGYKSDRTANGTDWGFAWDVNTGDIVHDKSIVARGGFIGNLDGTAIKATQDGSGNVISETYATKEELLEKDTKYDSYKLYDGVVGDSTFVSGTFENAIDYTKYSVISLCICSKYRTIVYADITMPVSVLNTGSMYSTTLCCHSNIIFGSNPLSSSQTHSNRVTMSAAFNLYSRKWSLMRESNAVGGTDLYLICTKK